MRIAVLGGGWFGCHLSRHLLRAGHTVVIFEPNGIFSGASGNNTDRVHQGFHYPRSAKTRQEIAVCGERFCAEYPTLAPVTSVYAIANESLLDFGTYAAICESARLPFQAVNPAQYGLVNVEGAVQTHERVVDTAAVKRQFEKELSPYLRTSPVTEVVVRPNMVGVVRYECWEWFDAVVDCTNLQRANPSLPVYYEAAMILECRGPADRPSITVMDGPFPAITATAEPGLYTLSHVIHTAIRRDDSYTRVRLALDRIKWDNRVGDFVKGIEAFYPDFTRNFMVTGCRTAVRTKPKNGTDGRECLTKIDGRVMTVACAKFTSIFVAQRRIEQWLANLLGQ